MGLFRKGLSLGLSAMLFFVVAQGWYAAGDLKDIVLVCHSRLHFVKILSGYSETSENVLKRVVTSVFESVLQNQQALFGTSIMNHA